MNSEAPRTHFWVGDPCGVVEPLHRVEGPWKEAWAERVARGGPSAHASVFHPHDAACLGEVYDTSPDAPDAAAFSMRFQRCSAYGNDKWLGFSRDFSDFQPGKRPAATAPKP